MGFQRDHQLMPVRIIDHLNHQLFSKTVMLHLRRHCQIDHMKPFCCMKLGSPAGIQIVFSLDEFPQFWNILKGDMSLVGTRPPTMDEWEKYELHHRKRLAIKPGLTGMWQVSGRSDITDFEEVVELDTKYIAEWCLKLDIEILFKTVMVVFRGSGAK